MQYVSVTQKLVFVEKAFPIPTVAYKEESSVSEVKTGIYSTPFLSKFLPKDSICYIVEFRVFTSGMSNV